MEEIWKPIPGYEGIYDASSWGRIRSTPGKTTANALYAKRVWQTRVLKTKQPINAKRHDKRVTLWKDGRDKDYLVARLVASAFLGAPKDGMTVNHKNGDYFDNRPDNLEWVTKAENIRHGFETGLYSSCTREVSLINENGECCHFRSLSEASVYLGRNKGYICTKHKRGSNTARGKDGAKYTFKVAEDG